LKAGANERRKNSKVDDGGERADERERERDGASMRPRLESLSPGQQAKLQLAQSDHPRACTVTSSQLIEVGIVGPAHAILHPARAEPRQGYFSGVDHNIETS
jgi:hypothetical protein